MSSPNPNGSGHSFRRSSWGIPLLPSLVYAAFVGSCLFYSYWSLSSVDSRNGGVTLRIVLLGDDADPRRATYRDSDAKHGAATARAWAAIATIAYVLGLGIFRGPRVIRLVSGNLLVLIVILLVLEGTTGVFGLHFPGIVRRGSTDRDLWVYDPSKGWFHSPYGSGEVFQGGPERGRVRMNGFGLRGREVSREKPEGVKRVLVFGDSFVFGLGVDQENLFTTHLEQFLDRSTDRSHRVLNMGVSGYSTDQQLILLVELGLRLAPDVVVLVMCDNDFLGNTQDFVYLRYYKPYYELGEQGELSLKNVPVPLLNRLQRVKLFLAQESNVWNFVRSRRSDDVAVSRFLGLFQVGLPHDRATDAVDITAALVHAFSQRVDAAGARVLVINTGHRGEQTPLYHALRPKLRGIEGLHLLGLEETLGNARRDAPDGLWDFPEDLHWNRDSHQLAAEVVCNYILTFGLLDAPLGPQASP